MFILGHYSSRDGRERVFTGGQLPAWVSISQSRCLVLLKAFVLAPLGFSSLGIGQFCSTGSDSFRGLREVRCLERGHLLFWGMLFGRSFTEINIRLDWESGQTQWSQLLLILYPCYPSHWSLFFCLFFPCTWNNSDMRIESKQVEKNPLVLFFRECRHFVKGLLTSLEATW